MLRGLYTATAGMITQQRKHDTITNNIGNADTPGYKQVNAVSRSFPEMLLSLSQGEKNRQQIGSINSGVFVEENLQLFQQGVLQETSQASDFALISNIQVPGITFDSFGKHVSPEGEIVYQPQAFFAVLNNDGEERYTRNGKFTVDAAGNLVTGEGYRVLGADGNPIVIQGNIEDIIAGADGTFYSGVGGQPIVGADGNPVALQLVVVDNPHLLIREGNGTYRIGDDAVNVQPIQAGDMVQVRQGYVERSNVDSTQSVIDMMTALRIYEANQRIVQYYDRSLDKAVNEVGKV